MNKVLFSMVAVVLVSGCAHSSNVQPNLPTADADHITEVRCKKVDGFVEAGDLIADGSRFVWDESEKAYRFLTSDEMKQRASAVLSATKSAVETGVKKAEEVYKEQSK